MGSFCQQKGEADIRDLGCLYVYMHVHMYMYTHTHTVHTCWLAVWMVSVKLLDTYFPCVPYSVKGMQTPGSAWPQWGTSVGLSSFAPMCGVPVDTWSCGRVLVLSDPEGRVVATSLPVVLGIPAHVWCVCCHVWCVLSSASLFCFAFALCFWFISNQMQQ